MHPKFVREALCQWMEFVELFTLTLVMFNRILVEVSRRA